LLHIFPVVVQLKKNFLRRKENEQFIFRRKYSKNIANNIAATKWPKMFRRCS
jgi:hypothetical protein